VLTLDGRRQRFPPGAPLDERIGFVTQHQYGVISLAQLRQCGLSKRAAAERVHSGRLRRVVRGVYAVGGSPVPPVGAVVAALLACGPGAAASHRTAAWIRSLRHDARTDVDITTGTLTGRRHGWVITHSGARLRARDVSLVDGIPTTSLARTLLDCAPVLGRRGTEKLIQQAERLQCFDLRAVRDIVAHVPGHPGAATLRAAITDAASARGLTASAPEDALLAAFRTAGLPEPECNAAIVLGDGSFAHADFLWRDQGLVVEADPRGTHDTTVNYRSDRRRDRTLKRVADLDTMRFCDEDLADPAGCAAEVAERLTWPT
jgi:predicted transcriptional regulator of viral defense system